MPIVFAPLNEELRIVKILVDEKTRKHLQNLGIIYNAKITVLFSSHGNLIIKVKECRLAIDKNVATKILVA